MKDKFRNENGAARQREFWALAKSWIITHRPDVAEAIRHEVDKKFPLKRDTRLKIYLPKSLMEMK